MLLQITQYLESLGTNSTTDDTLCTYKYPKISVDVVVVIHPQQRIISPLTKLFGYMSRKVCDIGKASCDE